MLSALEIFPGVDIATLSVTMEALKILKYMAESPGCAALIFEAGGVPLLITSLRQLNELTRDENVMVCLEMLVNVLYRTGTLHMSRLYAICAAGVFKPMFLALVNAPDTICGTNFMDFDFSKDVFRSIYPEPYQFR